MNIHHHTSVSETVDHSIQTLQNNHSENVTSDSPHLIWIDMPCSLNSTNSSKLSAGDCTSPEEINEKLKNILENTSSGDLVCVLTQGDIMEVKKLIAQKQK